MSVKRWLREDEKIIDFSDTRDPFIESWKTAAVELHRVKPNEERSVNGINTHTAFGEYVRGEQHIARQNYPERRRSLDGVAQLHQQLVNFENLLGELAEQGSDDSSFTQIQAIDTRNLWGLLYLNISQSMKSIVKLDWNLRWLTILRRHLELLNSVITQSRKQPVSDDNNLRMQLMEVFDPLMRALRESVDNLQRNYDDDEFKRAWPTFEAAIKVELEYLYNTMKHLREVMVTSQTSLAAQTQITVSTGVVKHRNPQAPLERAIFPVEILPHMLRAEYFVGRTEDLDGIHAVLGTELDNSLKTFTIYGRRGVGKTQLALEYARTHKAMYDAIFWVQCETRASLRQSFTNIALALELPDVNQVTSTFDENTMRVLRWLKHTEKRWLLIYDNAERDLAQQLHQYLPQKNIAKGAMLLTSRSYFNFFDDSQRLGETVRPFTTDESKELLFKYLGDNWQVRNLSTEDWLHSLEETALDIIIEKTRGLPIAIFRAAKLILDKKVGGDDTARTFVTKFNDSYKNLPKRQLGDRDDFVRALDALWAIAFEGLSSDAKTVLSILAFMSPDSILVDLFLPSDQSRLTDILKFCRSPSSDLVKQGPSIETVMRPSPALSVALEELLNKGLINRTGREISLHRTVSEGLAYADKEAYRTYFSAAVSLMYDAFPKQHEGRPLSASWDWCRIWIPHAVQLANFYDMLSKKRDAEGGPTLIHIEAEELLVRLLANCAWYLYEVADYDECLHVISVAKFAATDRRNSNYAHLLNTEGSIYYEQNKLVLARQSLEECLSIRQDIFAPDSLEMGNIYNNLCNLETSEGKVDIALQHIEKAMKIYQTIGDPAGVLLALATIIIGRCYFVKDEYDDAYRWYQQAEGLLNKKVARDPYFTASLYYAYGNLSYEQEELDAAAREYEKARQIMRSLNPMHPLVAACLYKLACIEFDRNHYTKSIGILNKAHDIADMKSNGRTNGTTLRILWKLSEAYRQRDISSPEGPRISEQCAIYKTQVAQDLGIDPAELPDDDLEAVYDRLVPGYFR